MAWRSSGTTNDELVDNLKRFAVISSPAVERGFRNVERRFFVPKGQEDIAHTDQPLQDGHVHISAPHIYGSALEALELPENSSLSFLNIGSGTGYLSCIVASILGSYSTNYGIDIHADVIDHCNTAIAKWRSCCSRDKLPHMQMLHGDALNIVMDEGEALIGFDRIYVGASVSRSYISVLRALLKAGGILVGPVGDELVKIVRTKRSLGKGDHVDDFSQQVLSGVRFASLVEVRSTKIVLPSRLWSPSVHHSYPEAFRRSSRELLLCSHSSYTQTIPPEQRPHYKVNLAATLPRAIWLEILSFTHHNWFEPPQSEDAFLRQRLVEERESSRKANEARIEAEARCHIAVRERDVYRLLARRWQSRLQLLLQQQRGDDGEEGLDLNIRESAAIFGLGAMMNDFQSESEDDSSESDGREMDAEETNDQNRNADDDEYDGDNDHEEFGVSFGIGDADDYIFSDNEDIDESGESDMSLTPGSPLTSSPAFSRRQIRTVSISEDL